jgi:molybdopterin/thiamine biosynthesis adenylyltransferase
MSILIESAKFYKEAFSRNRGLISDKDQDLLRGTRVAIPGLGGVGGVHATTLMRLGIGKFTIADGDTFAFVNFNRQVGAMSSTIDNKKVEVMKRTLLDINPFADIRSFGFIDKDNVDSFLEDIDIVIDGMDFFEIETRRLIFRKAREKGIPVVTAAPIGFGSSVLLFTEKGMSFDEYFAITDAMSEEEKYIRFGVGLCPSLLQKSYYSPKKINLKDHLAPSSVVGTLAAANWVATIVYKIVAGFPVESAPVSYHFDPFVGKTKRVNLLWGNANIIQRVKFWYLKKQQNSNNS